RHVVMFGEPESFVAQLLDVSRQVHRPLQSLRNRAALHDRRKIEDGERNHRARCTPLRDLPTSGRSFFAQSRLTRWTTQTLGPRLAAASIETFAVRSRSYRSSIPPRGAGD